MRALTNLIKLAIGLLIPTCRAGDLDDPFIRPDSNINNDNDDDIHDMRARHIPLLLQSASTLAQSLDNSHHKTCVVKSGSSDDTPAILEAFADCGHNGRIVFPSDTTYNVGTVMNVTGLSNVDIDIYGTLVWSTDIPYWLNNSLEVGFQNQSTAWILGGEQVRLNGYGQGTLYGNGDVWYEFISEQPNTSNYPGRPHAITLNGYKDSVFSGVRFIRSQMWTMSIINSENVLLEDVFVNNTGNTVTTSNTDGADTINSHSITFNNWEVYNGDDAIALKGNSTSISITNSRFYDGSGIAVGSLGQFYGETELVSQFRVDNCTLENTIHAVYFKTWTGDRNGYPPNGGGGGLGSAHDILFTNLEMASIRDSAVAFSQCTRFSGAPGDGNCTNSPFQITDVTFRGLRGTTNSYNVASLQCSAVAPCSDIGIFDVDLVYSGNGTQAKGYLCGNTPDTRGFECTGQACVGGSADGECHE